MKNINQILPGEIISDILSRLPADLVLECKSVSKGWKDLIQQPSFPKLHLARLNSADSGKLSYVFMKVEEVADDEFDFIKCLYYFEFDKNEDWNYVTPVYRKINIETKCEAYILIGSFNGLICIYGVQPSTYDAHGPATIMNPVTREYILLPEFDKYPEYKTKGLKSIQYYHYACGFGYLAETSEYKVVRIYKCEGEPNVVQVEVYTVGSGKGWRHVGKFDLGFRFYTHPHQTNGVFFNGCLHWRNSEGGLVVVFDLAQERFREHIPPPPLPTDTDDDGDFNIFIVIGVSGGGILYYAVYHFVVGWSFYEVWLLMKKNDNHVMKEQVQHQSWGWSKVNSLDQREPFAFTEDGTVLRLNQGKFQIFLSCTSTWENIVNTDISPQVYPHKHTLVSLKELGEEDAIVMKSQGIEETDR